MRIRDQFMAMVIAAGITGCAAPTTQYQESTFNRFIVPIKNKPEPTRVVRYVDRKAEVEVEQLRFEIAKLREAVENVTDNSKPTNPMVPSSHKVGCTPGSLIPEVEGGYIKVGGSRVMNAKEIGDREYGNKRELRLKNKPMDVVMRFNSRMLQKQWWDMLSTLGVNNKFSSKGRDDYLIYLGRYFNYDSAVTRKKQIQDKTGAGMVEIVINNRQII